MIVNIQGELHEFWILNVYEFNLTQKHMLTIVCISEGKIKLCCKGIDTVILKRLALSQLYTEKTLLYLKVFFVLFPCAAT
jgi:phospholipid-transporting ATPase